MGANILQLTASVQYGLDGEYIGSQDVLELLKTWGEGNCYTDPNNDQIVNIQTCCLCLRVPDHALKNENFLFFCPGLGAGA